MKKETTYLLTGGAILLAVFAFPFGSKSETVCAEEQEIPLEEETHDPLWEQEIPLEEETYDPLWEDEIPLEEETFDPLWEEEYEPLEEEEWIVHEEYYNYEEEGYAQETEETYGELESLEYLWNFDEQMMEGADPKRIDLLKENEGKNVKPKRNDADEIWIGVYPLAQYPDFPTGCEVTSMTMVLNYEGFDVTIGELADKYLKKGIPASASYREIFWGDPRSSEAFGCFAPVLVDAANKYLKEQKSDKRAIDLTGTKFEDLYEELRYGYPVIVWGSMYIDQDIIEIGSWEIDGEEVTWPGNEHCMVLTGFNLEEDTVRVCDPLRGIMIYDRSSFEDHYNKMECQAIVIRQEEEDEKELPVILPVE